MNDSPMLPQNYKTNANQFIIEENSESELSHKSDISKLTFNSNILELTQRTLVDTNKEGEQSLLEKQDKVSVNHSRTSFYQLNERFE